MYLGWIPYSWDVVRIPKCVPSGVSVEMRCLPSPSRHNSVAKNCVPDSSWNLSSFCFLIVSLPGLLGVSPVPAGSGVSQGFKGSYHQIWDLAPSQDLLLLFPATLQPQTLPSDASSQKRLHCSGLESNIGGKYHVYRDFTLWFSSFKGWMPSSFCLPSATLALSYSCIFYFAQFIPVLWERVCLLQAAP